MSETFRCVAEPDLPDLLIFEKYGQSDLFAVGTVGWTLLVVLPTPSAVVSGVFGCRGAAASRRPNRPLARQGH
jgi:hypothetical protein